MQSISLTSSPPAPSFSSYSSESLAHIAARVVRELDSTHDYDSDFYFETHHHPSDDDSSEDSEFEFPVDVFQFPSPADDLFQNGQIRPVYPVFNQDLLMKENRVVKNNRLPLRELFVEERETSLTAVDELAGVPEEMYCVWMPKGVEDARCKKSSSAGSDSKRWKLKNLLLNRSHSEGGKGSFVF